MSYVIGIDVGGTFTDAVAARDDGTMISTKTPSTPPDYAEGVVRVLDELSEQIGLDCSELLADTSYIAHGTTSALNALVIGDVGTVGWLTTAGHRDSIYIMNVVGRYAGNSPEQIQDILHTRKPVPLVPKSRAKEVVERIDYKGSVIVPLDEEQAREQIRDLIDQDVDAIAISTLWSFRNPVHERRLRELVHEQAAGMYVTLSSELSPRIREFSRNATTIMSTQVGPALARYLEPLEDRLRRSGLRGPLLVMQGNGGTLAAREAPKTAITTVGSVLSGGVTGATRLADQLGHRNVICTDVGGTTFLVGLIVDGEPVRSTHTVINQHIIDVPMLKVQAIGSGGGAIAHVDAGGNLRVGPRSAQAVPGPACYDQGGTEPTVTDADLVLGILNPDNFLGGRKTLSVKRAREAIEAHIAAPLGLSVEDAAAAVFAVQNSQTADLVRKVVVESGEDPRDFVAYAFGGAGPVHCFSYGAELGVARTVVPLGPSAAAFSAYGLAASNVGVIKEASDPATYPVPPAQVNKAFEALEAEARDALRSQGVELVDVVLRREIDIRYTMQFAELATPVPAGPLGEDDLAAVITSFEERYARTFGEGTGYSDAGFQFITYRVRATGVLPAEVVLPEAEPSAGHDVTDAITGHRPVLLDPRYGFVDTAVYDYRRLAPGDRFTGPAVVEVPTTTVAVSAHDTAEIDRLGNLVLHHHTEER
ncbi:hydantoinase/oxoprolinase family protein [Pseudonocardia sp. C8]|uniref:hydantoinase/oxoprolinase family protein n=1 Tax=Pseudonocardia sp. C8 TaxID=2762759 RepID=UPI00164306B7|nr:hydantoinase/oxoprolinase family protein [Pseudonocardia sp. C8]MBC3192167.1 hydantoinase/oxoprolinase family protein [Pseudonocardia sp. C8]